MIAGAMVLNPSLLVADEPVSALDASVRGEILALMLRPRARDGRRHPRRHARPRARLERRRPGGGDVPRPDRRGGDDRGAPHGAEPPLHARAPVGGARDRRTWSSRSSPARRPTRRASRPAAASTRAARSSPRARPSGSGSSTLPGRGPARRCPPATLWPSRRRRRETADRDAALQLVHRPRRARARARRACSRPPGSTRATPAQLAEPGSYFTLQVGRRAAGRRARPRGDAARVRERLPPPRRRGRVRRAAAARRSSATTTPGPTASTARCAPRRAPRPTPGSTAPSSACGPRRSTPWGPLLFVTPTPRRRRLPTRSASCPRSWRGAGLDVDALAFHCALRYSLERELEGRRRELPRVLPLRGRPPVFSEVIDVRPDRYRLGAHPTFASHYASPRGGSPRRRPCEGQFHLIWPNIKVNVMPGRPNLSSARSCRPDPTAPTASSTTSSGPTRTRAGSRTTSSSTTRWAPRTACSSSPSSAECARARSSAAACCCRREELIGEFQRWVADADGVGLRRRRAGTTAPTCASRPARRPR